MIIVGFMNTISITAIHLFFVLNNDSGGSKGPPCHNMCSYTLRRRQKTGAVKEYKII